MTVEKIKQIIKNTILFPLLIVLVCYLLIVVGMCIPSHALWENVVTSTEILNEQGIYPVLALDRVFLDNWTDAEVIEISYEKYSDDPFISALYSVQSKGTNGDGLDNLNSLVNGTSSSILDTSYRWNGFRLWVRPLLVIFNITEIRYLLFYINSALIIAVFYMMQRKYGVLKALPFLLSCFYFNFQMESISVLFFVDIFITLIGCISILIMDTQDERVFAVFAGCGTLVASTSMLIVPILTLGLPLVILLIKRNEENKNNKENIIMTIESSFSWLMGYLVGVFSKFFANRMIGNNLGGVGNATRWMQATGIGNRLYIVCRTIAYVFVQSKVKCMIAIVIFGIILIWAIKSMRGRKLLWIKYIPLCLVALYPCIYIFIMTAHANHGWTVFLFSISSCSILYILFDIISNGKIVNGEKFK